MVNQEVRVMLQSQARSGGATDAASCRLGGGLFFCGFASGLEKYGIVFGLTRDAGGTL